MSLIRVTRSPLDILNLFRANITVDVLEPSGVVDKVESMPDS